MATAPLCKVCGARHWASEPHVFVPKKPKTSPELDKALTILLGMKSEPKKRAERGTFDRTAYQREYMRKRRAEQKGKKPE